MKHSILFSCWDKDEPLEIQLEPEAILFKVSAGNELTFIAESNEEFKWTIRVENNRKALQLFPETPNSFQLTVYENSQVLDNWYKHM